MPCVIEIAFDNEEEVNKLVNVLLKENLICGAQVVKSDSKWRWQGQIEMCMEYLLLIKTKKELAKEIYDQVRKIHSYECFSFSIFPFESCNQEYLDWINSTVK